MKIITLLLTLLISASINANAQEQVGIVAIVGNDAITNQDVIHKIKLTLISSGIEGSPENIKKIRPQVIQSLINEKVQIAEAQALGINVTEEEVHSALSTLEIQNKMGEGELRKLLSQNQIPLSVMQNQIKAEIAWGRIKSTRMRSKVDVSEEDVDVFLRSQNTKSERTEYELHEIVIAVDEDAEEETARDLAFSLQKQLNEGKNFKAIAREFSAAASANLGGDLGWLEKGKIPKEIITELEETPIGTVSNPIRSIEGYFLVKYTDKRIVETNNNSTTLNLKKFSHKVNLKDPKSVESTMRKLLSIGEEPFRACTDGENYGKEKGFNFEDLGDKKFGSLPPQLKQILNKTVVAQASEPIILDGGAATFIICEKSEDLFPELDPKAREKAGNFMMIRKIELQARKYMRDLRAKTNIEIR